MRLFLLSLIILGSVLVTCAFADQEKENPMNNDQTATKNMRKQAANRHRRIIMNNDGDDAHNSKPDEPRTAEYFLSKRTTALAGSQVDAIFYGTGVLNLYSHQSEESELYESGDLPMALIQQGRDSLQLMVDFGHEHEMEVFWSMRMNDTHDATNPDLLPQWKKDHPEYLMGKQGDKLPYCARRWSSVDYTFPEVRDKVFRIIKDVCTRYDVDGIELDFFRHPVLFRAQVFGEPMTQEHCDMMTELMSRVRKMTEEVAEKRGRPLLIAVRAPDSVGYLRAMGIDLVRWLEDDLIDIITGSGYFHLEPWENLVALGSRYHVPVYACLSASRLENDIKVWRGAAMNAWDAGISGIYIFNKFDPKDIVFRELGSPETLKGLEKVYKPTPGKNIGYWLKGGESFLKELDK